MCATQLPLCDSILLFPLTFFKLLSFAFSMCFDEFLKRKNLHILQSYMSDSQQTCSTSSETAHERPPGGNAPVPSEEGLPTPMIATTHRYQHSKELKAKLLSSARCHAEGGDGGGVGKEGTSVGSSREWNAVSVKGLVDENHSLIHAGGFTLRKREGTSASPSLKKKSIPKENDDDDDDPGSTPAVAVVVEDNERIRLPAPAAAEVVACPSIAVGGATPSCRFSVTNYCTVNLDTLSAALVLGDCAALSFANAEIPGGRYVSGGRAQEEDLCRLLPQLYPSLAAASATYPIPPGTALLSRDLLAVRSPGSYALRPPAGVVSVITAAMPCGMADRRPAGGWAGSKWAETVTLRVRSVLHAAKVSGHANVVLGAFGCGAFGNPAKPVATIFRDQLQSPEFRGCFSSVVFAIIDPVGTGNLKPFAEVLKTL